MEEKDRIKDIKERFDESFASLATAYTDMQTLHKMYANKQWSDKDASNSKKRNIPPLTYNFMKKNVDVLVGIQRQNKTALKAYAEETGDNISASIASILLHHSMRKGNGYTAASEAYKDQCIAGLSWLSPYMDFSKDAINGEFKVICDSTFDMFFDPSLKEMDLSDCGYIVKRKVLSQDRASLMFPAFKDEIARSKSDYKSDYFVMEDGGLKRKVVIKEMWERVNTPAYTIAAGGQIITIPADLYDTEEVALLKTSPDYVEKAHMIQEVKLATLINNEILVYDGKSPYKGDYFPFVPLWGFYNKTLDTWNLKVQGVLHAIIDAQREFNKSKSNAMHYMLSSIHSGWMVDKGAVDDLRTLTKGMSTPVVQVNPGKKVERLQPPSINPVFASWSNDSFNDIMRIGLNAESLGFNSGAESAKAIKMKNMQGMASVGEIPDNFSFAMKQLGKIALSMIYQFYTPAKMKRILGVEYEGITDEMLLKVGEMEHDIEVDETTYSPVQKMYRLETKLQALQYKAEGIDIQDIIDDLELDAADRMKMESRKMMQQQQSLAMQQQQLQMQQEEMARKARVDESKAKNLDAQTIVMGANAVEKVRKLSGVDTGDTVPNVGGDM
jgi:hypothetical protein